jgi:hypothetical protein
MRVDLFVDVSGQITNRFFGNYLELYRLDDCTLTKKLSRRVAAAGVGQLF